MKKQLQNDFKSLLNRLIMLKKETVLLLICCLFAPFFLTAQCPANKTVSATGTSTWVNTSSTAATVTITAVGAQGGKNTATTGTGSSLTQKGGSGANMSGRFTVAAGATLNIIVGQAGLNSTNNSGGSGGGGSGVVNCGNPANCGTGTILIVAGGGGGTSGFGNGGGGLTANGTGNGGAAGTLTATYAPGGGGGLNSAGATGIVTGGTGGGGGGQIIKTGTAAGGAGQTANGGATVNGVAGGAGMGGGGGSSNGTASGGGGYSGGNGETATLVATGGGSFNSGTNVVNTAGVAGGAATTPIDGSVTITCLSVLPVELLSFNATAKNKTIDLKWSTASERNSAYFNVEQSTDSKTFLNIGQVKSFGTTNAQQAYAFLDEKPNNGINYYRLRQVDLDGQEVVSKVVSVLSTAKGNSKIKIFPSHTEGSLSIESGALAIDNIQVFNNVGQLVLSSGATSRLDLSAMPSGLYLVQVKAGGVVATEKVFKR